MSLAVSGLIVASGCIGQNRGQILTTVIGGTPPYTYAWSDGNTNADRDNLFANLYWVKVTDSLGETGEAAFSIPASDLSLDFTIQQPNIFITTVQPLTAPKGSIIAIPINGHQPFTYLWSTGETTARIEGNAGVYTCRVRDSWGCEVTESVTLIVVLQQDIDAFTCCAGKLAKIYVCQREDGLFECAEATMQRLKLLKGYIKDLCAWLQPTSKSGLCLSMTEVKEIIENAKKICECCVNDRDYISNPDANNNE